MSTTNSSRGRVAEIPLDQIEIGTAQVRTDLSSGLDDLVQSIRRQGLLQPIVVVKLGEARYEVIAGQRRFLAHQRLGWASIRAIIRDASEVDETDRVTLSLTENLIRRGNSQKELIDACTKLHRRYGSIKIVAEETGLSPAIVGQYVKYDQLVPELKDKVDNAQLDMKVALQAQKAATSSDGTVDTTAASKFAEELAVMSNPGRRQFVRVVSDHPDSSVEERIELGRKQPVLKPVVVTLEASLLRNLQTFARDEGLNQDDAAVVLIEDGLVRRGFSEESE